MMAELAASVPAANRVREKNIQTCVRLRPLNRRESTRGIGASWEWSSTNMTQIVDPKKTPSHLRTPQSFTFDRLFGPQTRTAEIYDSMAKEVVEAAMEGYHGSVCAYGQTSTGKTHTMQGSEGDPGITPLAVQDCFDYIANNDEREYVLRISYLEIYNETIRDLLSPSATNIRIMEDKKKGVVVRGVREEIVMNAEQVYSLLNAGERSRHTGTTDANALSSRSHSVFRMIIESSKIGSNSAARKSSTVTRTSTLSLVDLAGSESARLANTSGDRQKEGSFINKSLLTLAHVIWKLSDPKTDKTTHIPYRDSKLTRILQQSLGGNAQIALVCTVTLASDCVEETINTLKFANRAKQVKQRVELNEVVDPAALISQYRDEITRLRQQLEAAQEVAAQQAEKMAKPASTMSGAAEGRLPSVGADEEEQGGIVEVQMQQAIANLERLILKSNPRSRALEQSGSGLSASGLAADESGGGSGLHAPVPLFHSPPPNRKASASAELADDDVSLRQSSTRSMGSAEDGAAVVSGLGGSMSPDADSLPDPLVTGEMDDGGGGDGGASGGGESGTRPGESGGPMATNAARPTLERTRSRRQSVSRRESFATELENIKHMLQGVSEVFNHTRTRGRSSVGSEAPPPTLLTPPNIVAAAFADPTDERAIAAGEEKNEIDLMKVDKEFLEAQLGEKDMEVREARKQLLDMGEVLTVLEAHSKELEAENDELKTSFNTLDEILKGRDVLIEEKDATIKMQEGMINDSNLELDRLRSILSAREAELLEIKGVNVDEECF